MSTKSKPAMELVAVRVTPADRKRLAFVAEMDRQEPATVLRAAIREHLRARMVALATDSTHSVQPDLVETSRAA